MHLHFVAETDGPDGTSAIELRRLEEEIRSVKVGNFTSNVIIISPTARLLLLLLLFLLVLTPMMSSCCCLN